MFTRQTMCDPPPKRPEEVLEQYNCKITKSTETNLIQIAREIWYRGKNKKIKYESTEDRDFREFFGCGLSVASEIWDLLSRKNLLPQGEMQCHLLLALMFMKIYGKEKSLHSCRWS